MVKNDNQVNNNYKNYNHYQKDERKAILNDANYFDE